MYISSHDSHTFHQCSFETSLAGVWTDQLALGHRESGSHDLVAPDQTVPGDDERTPRHSTSADDLDERGGRK